MYVIVAYLASSAIFFFVADYPYTFSVSGDGKIKQPSQRISCPHRLYLAPNFLKNQAHMAISRDTWLLIGAFAVIYIVWGSTYLVNYFAIQGIPPFFMSGTRFLSAGGLLLGYAALRGKLQPLTGRQLANAALMGILFLTIGTGGVVWAEQFVDTGIAALVVAFDPLLIMLLAWGIQGRRPGAHGLLGAALGIAGMAILVGQQEITGDPDTIKGLAAIFVSLSAWAIASVYIGIIPLPQGRMQSTALQMLSGGIVLLLYSFVSGEYRDFSLERVTQKAALSWLYLVFMGSILAFSCFNYLLLRVAPEKVATSTYVNPVVALLLGWGFNAEVVSLQSMVAAAVLLTGVFFINRK